MRKMIARTSCIEAHRDASAAIRASRAADSRRRTVSDDQVRGKNICQMLWNDSALSLGLEPGGYLNIVAKSVGVECSLGDSPVVDVDSESDEEVHFELDGHTIPWHRVELYRNFVGRNLNKLWFGSEGVYIYTDHGILACYLVESSPEGIPWLFWTESD